MIRQTHPARQFMTRRVLLSLGIASMILIGIATVAATHVTTAAAQPAAASAALCSQAAIVAAEGVVPVLDAGATHVAIPSGEPEIVATVHGTAITAQQLETLVAHIERSHQVVLAANPTADLPPDLKAVLTESPAQVRQQALTSLIERQLWLADGQAHGLSASAVQARDAATRFGTTALSDTATSDSRTQFEAYLCVNRLSAASFATDPRVIQSFQATATISAAKSAVVSTLTPAQQQDQTAIAAALAVHVKALWTGDSVQVFLSGVTPAA